MFSLVNQVAKQRFPGRCIFWKTHPELHQVRTLRVRI